MTDILFTLSDIVMLHGSVQSIKRNKFVSYFIELCANTIIRDRRHQYKSPREMSAEACVGGHIVRNISLYAVNRDRYF